MGEDKKLDWLLYQTTEAAYTLRDPQGRIARRNARKRVLARIKKLKAYIAAAYPLERKSTKISKRRSRSEIIQRLHETHTNVTDAMLVAQLETNGIRTRRIKNAGVYVPKWALTLCRHGQTAHLKAAHKSQKVRKALLAEIELKKEDARA